MKICIVNANDSSKFNFYNSLEEVLVYLYEEDLCLDTADIKFDGINGEFVMMRSFNMNSPEIHRHYIYIGGFNKPGGW